MIAERTVESETDGELVERSWRDPERFAALYDRHAAQIHRYIARRLGRDNADDLMADTFVEAFRQRDRYDTSRANARPWLYGIATNLVNRHRRGEVRFYKAIARTGVDPARESQVELVDDQVSAQAARRQLAAGLARLNQGERDALLIMAAGDMSYDEVAEALDVPRGTVASRVNRARKKMRQALGGANPTKEFSDE